MNPFKIGEKDRRGRQKRIEHNGPYLRASRTGGVSLRAQTRAAGINATVNTRHGLRLSTRLARNTQVAMQNGRFVLRGRYGSDAARFNLSKSGVTVSTRTPSGTVNWIKPGRSSFKLAGMQMRGEKAVWMQLAYLLVMLVFGVVQFFIRALIQLTNGLAVAFLSVVYRLRSGRALAVDEALRRALETEEVHALGTALFASRGIDPSREAPRGLLAGLSDALVRLGRGDAAVDLRAHGLDSAASAAHFALQADIVAAGRAIRDGLPAASDARYPPTVVGLALVLGEALAAHLDQAARLEALLALDDACLNGGPRTLLQEAMIDRLAEVWQADVVLEGEA